MTHKAVDLFSLVLHFGFDVYITVQVIVNFFLANLELGL